MERLLSPAGLTREALALGAGNYLADPISPLLDSLSRFRPPDRIATVDWAEKNRKFRLTDSGALVPYDRMRTPYNIAAMEALDEPGVELVVMVKPSRSGGTTVFENYLGKMIDVGPMVRTGWYLGSNDAVKKYCEGTIKPLFEDHPRLQARIGKGRSDDNETTKRIAGQLLEFLPANDAAFRNREFGFGVLDEPDGWSKFAESPKIQLRGRQKNVGRRRKGGILSHPDRGWRAGVAPTWETTSRGIFVMRCPECSSFAAAHATKFWPGVPEFRLDYARDTKADVDTRIAAAGRTAGLACPHCGAVLSDRQRDDMVDEAGLAGWWMHRGQTLDAAAGIQGAPDPHTERGFWVHGIMVKTSPLAELARGLEEALIRFERSGGSKLATKALREFMSKQLGEIFEGKAGIEGVTSAKLQERAAAEAKAVVGVFPSAAHFIVAAADPGAGKFDVSFRAFDLEARSWWLDRITIRQRLWPDGQLRDIRTRERIEDWSVLLDQVLDRRFEIEGRPGWAMPVAALAVDVGDGNVTWVAREFARRALSDGQFWGSAAAPFSRVRLIQGSSSAKAPELGPPRKIDRDEKGQAVRPVVIEHTVGAHALKELALERLAVSDGGPGQCWFAEGIASNYFDEYFNEPLIDGKFERQGPNESLDLFGYEEAVRLMLRPDRKDIVWSDPNRRPPWARPINLYPEGGDHAAPVRGPDPEPAPQSRMSRFDALNRRTKPNG